MCTRLIKPSASSGTQANEPWSDAWPRRGCEGSTTTTKSKQIIFLHTTHENQDEWVIPPTETHGVFTILKAQPTHNYTSTLSE